MADFRDAETLFDLIMAKIFVENQGLFNTIMAINVENEGDGDE